MLQPDLEIPGRRNQPPCKGLWICSKIAGVSVVFRPNIHQKFALIDQKVVWYGSINLLSFGSAEESIMRLESPNIASELLKSLGKTRKAIMGKEKLIDILRNYKNEPANYYGIMTIGVFGSTAPGMLVRRVMSILSSEYGTHLFMIVGIKEEMEERLHNTVDIVVCRDNMNLFLEKRVDEEAMYCMTNYAWKFCGRMEKTAIKIASRFKVLTKHRLYRWSGRS